MPVKRDHDERVYRQEPDRYIRSFDRRRDRPAPDRLKDVENDCDMRDKTDGAHERKRRIICPVGSQERGEGARNTRAEEDLAERAARPEPVYKDQVGGQCADMQRERIDAVGTLLDPETALCQMRQERHPGQSP